MYRSVVATCAVVAALASGCTYSTSKGIAQTGGGCILGGGVTILVGAGSPGADPQSVENLLTVSAVLLVGGATLALLGLFGMAAFDDAPPEHHSPKPKPRPEAPEPSTSRRERALFLTNAARTAARRGDCGQVIKNGGAVRLIDTEFHATVFVQDIELQPCLLQAAPQPVAPVP